MKVYAVLLCIVIGLVAYTPQDVEGRRYRMKIKGLGCWWDRPKRGGHRSFPHVLLEEKGSKKASKDLSARAMIGKCAQLALRRGIKLFAMQNGECRVNIKERNRVHYKRMGSTKCRTLGGLNQSFVFRIEKVTGKPRPRGRKMKKGRGRKEKGRKRGRGRRRPRMDEDQDTVETDDDFDIEFEGLTEEDEGSAEEDEDTSEQVEDASEQVASSAEQKN